MKEKPIDIAIVGAGAAGLMSAIWAGRAAQARHVPLQILLLDTREKIGAKILMSGGTRCNVTHKKVNPSDFQGGPSHFIKHVLEAFTPEKTVDFFKEIGVDLVLEPTGKYFPATHSAQTVLDALVKEATRAEVILKTGVKISKAKKAGDLFEIKNSDGTYQILVRKIILTTGGLSYPDTGSDGAGYGIAKSLGHTVLKTFPALTPLLTDDADWKLLSGITLQTQLSFYKNGKKIWEGTDSFLFTHFGFSGPAALNISRHFAGASPEENPKIMANFLPGATEKSSLPERFLETFMKKVRISKNENSKRLIHLLSHYPLEVTGVFGYKKAEATAGGVDLKEVKVSTMESKLVDGLHLAGEILDVDGRIGGFNFQWAWSTGQVAGRSAAQSLL